MTDPNLDSLAAIDILFLIMIGAEHQPLAMRVAVDLHSATEPAPRDTAVPHLDTVVTIVIVLAIAGLASVLAWLSGASVAGSVLVGGAAGAGTLRLAKDMRFID